MAKRLTCGNKLYFFDRSPVKLSRRGAIFCPNCNKEVFVTPKSFLKEALLFCLFPFGLFIWWRYFAEYKQLGMGKLFAKEDIPFWVKIVFFLALVLLFILLVLAYTNIFVDFFKKP